VWNLSPFALDKDIKGGCYFREMSVDDEYDRLVRDVLDNGSHETSRNGKVRVRIGASMRFDLTGGKLPFITKKRLAWKTCLRELLWFISGGTDSNILSAAGCKIWDVNGSRDFLDGRGLKYRRQGDLGPIYGHQWRHYGASYNQSDTDYTGKGIDQLQTIIETLKDPIQRNSRRMVMSAWSASQLDEMALPPCHVLVQFHVTEGNKLHCSFYQRSGDVGLGIPFNIGSYAMLTHLLAYHCGLEAVELYHTIGNVHIYEQHVDGLREYLGRDVGVTPTISFREKKEIIDNYREEDFLIAGYSHGPTLKLTMIA